MTKDRKVHQLSGLLLSLAVIVSASLVAGAAPLYRANGKIAFTSTRDGNREIYVMNSDGTEQVRLTNNSWWDSNPTWSPDGRKIAFVSQNESGIGAIFVMNADGTGRTEVTQNFSGAPSWSPDGRKFVFTAISDVTENAIFIVNVDGSGRQKLTSDNEDYDPVWSPDGTKILFTRYGIYPPVGYGGTMLHTINVDGTDLRPLVNGFADGWNEDYPDWSPTVNKIVYSVNQWDFNSALFIANADGTNRQYFAGCGLGFCTSTDSVSPAWSPDGSKIVFSRDDAFNTYSEICVKNIDGSGFAVLTSRTQGKNFDPSWQPLVDTLSVTGRVMTPSGVGLRNAIVSLTDSSGVRRTATTSSLGFYSISDVQADKIITITVSSRRYRFQPVTRGVNESLTNVDFMGIE